MGVNYDFVAGFIRHLTALAKTRDGLRGLRQYVAARTPESVLTDDAFAGQNQHVAAADFGPALAALDALDAVLVDPATGEPTGHGKALAKFVRPADLA